LRESTHLNREPAYVPEPDLHIAPDRTVGPVMVAVTYTVAPENEEAFLEAMEPVRRSRMRTGAVQWGIYRHGEKPHRLVELYEVPTWGEHLRQHTGRLTGADQDAEERAHALSDTPPQAAHLIPPHAAEQRTVP
jgi:hypothetical protein